MTGSTGAARERSVGGRVLLRLALVSGVFIIVTFAIYGRPMPGAPSWFMNLGEAMFEAGMIMGLVAPVLAIVGAVLMFRAQRRLSALDWVSLVSGLLCVLLPVAFVMAYSNCPNGVC